MDREPVLNFAATLTKEDGRRAGSQRQHGDPCSTTPYVNRIAIANPLQVRAIDWAKVKDRQDDGIDVVRLRAARFWPRFRLSQAGFCLQSLQQDCRMGVFKPHLLPRAARVRTIGLSDGWVWAPSQVP
jgi:hypothetical protein